MNNFFGRCGTRVLLAANKFLLRFLGHLRPDSCHMGTTGEVRRLICTFGTRSFRVSGNTRSPRRGIWEPGNAPGSESISRTLDKWKRRSNR